MQVAGNPATRCGSAIGPDRTGLACLGFGGIHYTAVSARQLYAYQRLAFGAAEGVRFLVVMEPAAVEQRAR